MERKLLLIGGGGHCRSVIDSILNLGIYTDLGIVDRENASALEIPVVGADEDLPDLIRAGWTEAFITVGSVGDPRLRRRLYRMVTELGLHVPAIVDPTAVIARGTNVQAGSYVGKRAIVNSNAKLGVCTIVNTGAIVEHDCTIGDFAHISPGAVLCGQVSVGEDAHVGAGSVVRQQLSIGRHALIGMGSVVTKNIPDNVTAYGNPCRVVK